MWPACSSIAKGTFLTQLSIPFFKHATPDIGLFYLAVCVLIIVASSNGVNLTDGLDGLAIGPVLTVCATFLLFAYLAGNIKFAQYLQIFYVKGAGELTILCGAMLGAGIGFLWYNAYPAELFMGDTGSLSLGAGLGVIAVMIKQEFLLVIVGGIFVIEALSVIIQVLSFKTQGQEGLPHGAHSPPFRAEGLERGKDRGPFLDHIDNTGASGHEHAEAEIRKR